ncbi:M3 family metallopeptidase [Mariprofundus ferrooxydans]|uniref:oligopeptidase A n=1 Tax=Mariprofundus ferrooxydans PV-1 TaxID=314345 RepID=Q0EX51_9PROT|nr:M3 family metallopeptidase [Mariprofundus ferrooxydans]EAU53823.1 oligopeptidase A [Mariprofundus ferrooxydans PV-1]KON47325.1 oligopeptidase A [Mariprofundus ferrooxydans]
MTTLSPPDNPLIQSISTELPLFDKIKPEHVLPALAHALSEARQQVVTLTTQTDPTWTNLMQPLEAMDEMLGRVWGPVTHLNAVCDSDEMRSVYQQGVAQMSEWHTELAQNELLYAAMRKIHERPDFAMLSRERQQVLEHALRDFRLSGAELEGESRTRFKSIMLRLSELSTTFSQHVMDATQAFELHLTDTADIAGLPESVAAAAAQRAEQQGKDGWLITLDAPSYIPFMQYAENSGLRQQIYTAYVTRASAGELDNGPLIRETLSLKAEAATLLGFNNYGEYSLATKMAGSVKEVTAFLRELAEKSKAFARQDLEALQDFAEDELGLSELKAWDIAFVSERLRLKTFAVSQEELKPYFPEQSVINGMFGLVERLYGIAIRPNESVPRWHANVHYYELFDTDNQQIAAFYLDPYARAHKRGGAWMDECVTRWQRPDGQLQLPVAYLVCNFDAPVGDKPALWTHDEVTTLFHEFGHGLHHMLTKVSELGVSGIRGVPWDAVELPSQFMENFCWEKEVVDLFARHYETGETMPDALFNRMLAAKNFQSGMQMLRQVEFSLFDMLLHSDFDPTGEESVHDLIDQVRDEVAVLKPPAFNRFENSFSHIFAGGYAAGYYSYKWAELLSADAFAAFEEEGILNTATAARFRGHILSIGGSSNIMDAFTAFRGRKPTVEALLRHSGLTAQGDSHG